MLRGNNFELKSNFCQMKSKIGTQTLINQLARHNHKKNLTKFLNCIVKFYLHSREIKNKPGNKKARVTCL